VLTGLQSDDQGFAQVGVILAEKLGMAVERDSDNQGRWRSPRRIYAMSLC